MKYSIYQVAEESKESFYLLFASLEMVNNMGLHVNEDHYNKVYEGEIKESDTMLDDIYCKFNLHRPNDFKCHSLSVSDVVEIEGKFYFCDSYDWVQILNFKTN